MRGARTARIPAFRAHGITPAYAGSTTSSMHLYLGVRDHPRVCGEHLPLSSSWQFRLGSPPRMRGARGRGRNSYYGTGITPAYAGSTIIFKYSKIITRDHPRVCGEHDCVPLPVSKYLGSPPRMRGARSRETNPTKVIGITPAYAGSTSVHCRCDHPGWDHPRVCGEHYSLELS